MVKSITAEAIETKLFQLSCVLTLTALLQRKMSLVSVGLVFMKKKGSPFTTQAAI